MKTLLIERNPASFRDPTGFVYRQGGKIYRTISERGKSDFAHFLRSGLAGRLMQEKKIVPFQPTENGTVIELRELDFITYPYEWSFSALRDAALLTLELTDIALEHDMILQDATAFNITFEKGRPIFMDHGSFCIYHPGDVWGAYRQFVMHFLAPLLLMKYMDLRCLDFFRSHVEGFPLDFASRLLPWRTWLKSDPYSSAFTDGEEILFHRRQKNNAGEFQSKTAYAFDRIEKLYFKFILSWAENRMGGLLFRQ